MTQISEIADKTLNQKSREIGQSKKIIEEQEKKFDEAWEEVFSIFEEFNLSGNKARFIANDGFYLYKQTRPGKSSLDEEKLYAMIFQKYTPRKAQRIWNSITSLKIDSKKLEAAVQTGLIEAEIVNECVSTSDESHPRIRNEWTKEDREKAAVLGILKEE